MHFFIYCKFFCQKYKFTYLLASTLLSNDAGDSSVASSSKQTTISICTNKQLVTKAEIIWVLDVVMSKYLFNSSSNKSDLFTIMFPGNGIAKNFSSGETKYGSIVKFGIVLYFVELLNSQLKDLEYFVALFDESFNCVAKKTQMDLQGFPNIMSSWRGDCPPQ